MELLDDLDQGLHKADAVGAATMPPGRISGHMGDVVGNHKALKTDAAQGFDDFKSVDLAAVDKGLVKVFHRSNNVAEVDVDNLIASAKVFDCANDVVVATHLRPAAHAEVEAVVVAIECIHIALEVVERAADSRDTA